MNKKYLTYILYMIFLLISTGCLKEDPVYRAKMDCEWQCSPGKGVLIGCFPEVDCHCFGRKINEHF